MIHLLGQTHRTADGRSYYIEACQILPVPGEYEVIVFDIRKAEGWFTMGVAYPREVVGKLKAMGVEVDGGATLMEHGLAQLREHLDRGLEEDGRVFQSELYPRAIRYFGGAGTRRYSA